MQEPTIKLRVKRLHPDAVLPTFGTPGAACFDLYAVDTGTARPHPTDQSAAIFRTGLAFEVPAGWALEVYSRSGQGFNDGVRLSNCVGIIDSDYRGEVMVSLRTDSIVGIMRYPTPSDGDRIAQAKLVRVPRVELVEVEDLADTERGAGGFGSTGA